MKYERITERRETPLTISMWAGDSESLKVYNRLAKLEDKIEGREFIPADEYESARHRAEVVERAFDNIMEVFHEMLSAIFASIKIDLDEWKKDNLAIAEKELSEKKI